MSVYSIVFSPTGGTKKVMKILSKEFLGEKSIDLTKTDTNYGSIYFAKDDLCLVGVPSYGGRVPKIALDRLGQIKGNGASAIIVVTYGNRAYDDTILELKNEITQCGFQVVSAIGAVCQHSIMNNFGEGRPDKEDEKELHKIAENIKNALKNKTFNEDLQIPGNTPYREYGGVPFKPKTNRKCNECGLCCYNCPVGAISKDNPKVTDTNKCISCMRCVSICPQNARAISKIILFVASQKMKKVCSERKNNEFFV